MKIEKIIRKNHHMLLGTGSMKNLNFIISERPEDGLDLFKNIVNWFSSNKCNIDIKLLDDNKEGDFVYIDDEIFDRFLSNRSELRKQFHEAYRKISALKSQTEIKKISSQINDDAKRIFPTFQIDLTLDDTNIQYPKNLDNLQAPIFICSILSFIKKCLDADITLLFIGRWFDRLDKEVRYDLCRFFLEDVNQVIIFTSQSILETPIKYGPGYKSFYKNLRYENIGSAYELIGDGFSQYGQD